MLGHRSLNSERNSTRAVSKQNEKKNIFNWKTSNEDGKMNGTMKKENLVFVHLRLFQLRNIQIHIVYNRFCALQLPQNGNGIMEHIEQKWHGV